MKWRITWLNSKASEMVLSTSEGPLTFVDGVHETDNPKIYDIFKNSSSVHVEVIGSASTSQEEGSTSSDVVDDWGSEPEIPNLLGNSQRQEDEGDEEDDDEDFDHAIPETTSSLTTDRPRKKKKKKIRRPTYE